jgi:hypothetical protein
MNHHGFIWHHLDQVHLGAAPPCPSYHIISVQQTRLWDREAERLGCRRVDD